MVVVGCLLLTGPAVWAALIAGWTAVFTLAGFLLLAILLSARVPPWSMLVLAVLALPAGSAFLLPESLGGAPVIFTELFLVAAVILAFAQGFRPPGRIVLIVVLLIAWSIAATAFAGHLGLSLAALKTATLAALASLVVLGGRGSVVSKHRMVRALLLAGAAVGPIVTTQMIIALSVDGGSVSYAVASKSIRVGLGASNYLAAVLVLSAGAAVAMRHIAPQRLTTLLALGSIGASLLGVVLTGSRTQLLVMLVGVPVFWLFGGGRGPRGPRQLSGIALVGGVIAAFWFLLPLISATWLPALRSGITNYRTFDQREALWQQAVQLIVANPITGVGLHGFTVDGQMAMAHNVMLQVGVETGVVGLVLYLWLIWRFLSAAPRGDGRRVMWGLLLIVLASGALEPTLRTREYDYLFWIVWAACLAPSLKTTGTSTSPREAEHAGV